MNVRAKRFETDSTGGKFLGVCAGIAEFSGVDVTIIRVGAVILTLTLAVAFPLTLVAYLALALLGRPDRRVRSARGAIPTREESRERMRSLDLRMQAIETYATSANSRLAREIEELR